MTYSGQPLRIGTRSSKLATAQSRLVASELENSGVVTELIPITTAGDVSREPLHRIGGTGVFVAAVRQAVLEGRCDIAVHSLKDLPVAPAPGLVLAAITEREDVRDALCSRDQLTLNTLPPGSRVGTGSPRRAAFLRRQRPDIDVVPLRGNVDSRLARITEGEIDAVVLAVAGLSRIGRIDAVSEFFDPLDALPAPGQGALAIECRAEDHAVIDLVNKLDHHETRLAVTAERAVLAALQAGCTAPIGCYSQVADESLTLYASLWRESNEPPYAAQGSAPLSHSDMTSLQRIEQASVLGDAIAAQLRDMGAGEYLARTGALVSVAATPPRDEQDQMTSRAPAASTSAPGRDDVPRLKIASPRSSDGTSRWHEQIAAAGGQPVDIDLLSTLPASHPELVLDLVHEIGRGHYDVLVFTSARTVASLAAAAANTPGLAAAQHEHGFAVACIGTATRRAAERIGLNVQICPMTPVTNAEFAHAIIDYLNQKTHEYPRRHIALPGSARAEPTVANLLSDHDCIVDVVDAYTVRAHPHLREQVAQLDPHVVILTSGSAVEAWLTTAPTQRDKVHIVTVGSSAHQTLVDANTKKTSPVHRGAAAHIPTPDPELLTDALREIINRPQTDRS